jgi:hypothetical protein
MGVHAICVILASAFTFFACFALMGLLMSALPNRLFRRVSVLVRLVLIVALIVLLCTNLRFFPRFANCPPTLIRSFVFCRRSGISACISLCREGRIHRSWLRPGSA